MRKYFVLCVATLLFVGFLCLSACRTHGLFDDGFKGAVTITPELLQEISAEIFGTRLITEEVSPTTTVSGPAVTLADDSDVLWLANGSAYHLYKDCHYLRDKENVIEGSVMDAKQQGVEKFCSSCEKQLNP